MSKFTKTLIASALAVAVAGPAAASDLKEGDVNGAYKGSKTSVKITPAGCPNDNTKNITTKIGFHEIAPFAGCWVMVAADFEFDGDDTLYGGYIERKVGKDLTMSLSGESLFDEVIDEMYYYLMGESKCDLDEQDNTIWDEATVKKARGKLSKNGDSIQVDIQVDSKYKTNDGKTKNVKGKIKGKMDFDANESNPGFDCGLLIVNG